MIPRSGSADLVGPAPEREFALLHSDRHLEALRKSRSQTSLRMSVAPAVLELSSGIQYAITSQVVHLYGMVALSIIWGAGLAIHELLFNRTMNNPARMTDSGIFDSKGKFHHWNEFREAVIRQSVDLPETHTLRLFRKGRGSQVNLSFDPDAYDEYELQSFAEERIRSCD